MVLDDSFSRILRDIVSSYAGLRVEADSLGDYDNLFELGMTSTANVNVMLALEERFDIEIPEELLVRETFESLSAIRRSIVSLLPSTPSGGLSWR